MSTTQDKNSKSLRALRAWLDEKESQAAFSGRHTHEILELATLCATHHMDQLPQKQALPHLLCHAPVSARNGLAAAIVAAMTSNNLVSYTVERWDSQVRDLFGDTVADSWATLAFDGHAEEQEKFRARLLAREGRPGKIARAVYAAQMLKGFAHLAAQIRFAAYRPLNVREQLDADRAFLESLPAAGNDEHEDLWIGILCYNARHACKALRDQLDEFAAEPSRQAA